MATPTAWPWYPRALSRNEVRDVDRRATEEFGLPGIVLMENAGRGAAELLLGLGISGTVVVCAGKGNNGGDGFVIARHLSNRGFSVRLLVFGARDRFQGDAAVNLRVIEAARASVKYFDPQLDPHELRKELESADWIVDSLLGTGTQGEIREPFTAVIGAINASGRNVLAVDLPSGLDCDTGRPLGACVRANHTATFVAPKLGFAEPAAREWTGQVHVVDIGVPRALLESL